MNVENIRNKFYCIAIYDVRDGRVQKVHKIFKKYLKHKQYSVFLGTLLKSEFLELKNELDKVINKEEDDVCFLTTKSENEIREINLGRNVLIEEEELFF